MTSLPLASRSSHRWSLIIAHCSLIIIGLMLIAPLLQALPLQSDDGALHIYRTVALDRAIQDGLLYPRWFPDLAYGYGFPFFNYREPLGYYAIELLHLIGLSFTLGLNLILAGSVIFSGLAMLWWVSDIFDLTAGFAAGVIYMAAPYLLIGPIDRANLPEVIALALLPLILFFFRRLIAFGGKKYLAAAVVSYSALLLTHNISSLIFTPMLLAYSFWLVIYSWPVAASRSRQNALRDLLLAAGLALALTAFFWLPALVEGNYVQLYLTHTTRNNDYHFNFLSLAELFGGPGSADPNLLNPPLRFMLGWPQIAGAALGLLALRRKPARDQRAHISAALIAALAFIFMTLSVSLPIWDHLPLIRFVQFPWRFVGRAMLPLALLSGAAIYFL
ncbi:MAG TPA: 6-pyruvoyl-tetrahydropterin synthase-related protein, partial [Anaerolineae bacterium]|nr:6-pyruvoyl-tetrahydropterin synthase-related protein [Anaerolineae bacterium]